MSRRKHKQLSPTRSSPAWDKMLRRVPAKRTFTTLQPGGTEKAVPNPYLGVITRFMTVEAVAEYKTFPGITTTAWNTGNFKDQYNGYAYSPVFTGTEIECYYYSMAVADESVDDLTVTMQPLRFSLLGCDTAGDTFDVLWDDWPKSGSGTAIHPVGTEFPFGDGLRTIYSGSETFPLYHSRNTTGTTLLPVSGNSHISDNDPSQISLINGPWQYAHTIPTPGYRANAFHDLYGWNPRFWLNPNQEPGVHLFPDNAEISVRFVQLRKNGASYLSVFDFEPYLQFKRNGNRTSPQQSTLLGEFGLLQLFQPGNAVSNADKLREMPVQFQFTAGDTVEIDVWMQLKARPRIINGVNYSSNQSSNVLALCARRVASNDSVKNDYLLYANQASQGALQTINTGINTVLRLDGLISGSGWDFQRHTVSFDLQGSVWYPGSGAPGPRKAEEWTASAYPAPTIAAVGATCYGTGSGSVSPPSGTVSGQTLILIIETANESVTTPSGWLVLKPAAGTGTGGDVTATRISSFYKHITETETTNTPFNDPGDHWIAVMFAVNNANKTGSPVASSRTDQLATAGTLGTLTGVATTSENSLILLCGSNGLDASGALTCTVTNSGVTSLTERVTTTQTTEQTARVRPSAAVSAVWNTSAASDIDDNVIQPAAGDGAYCYAVPRGPFPTAPDTQTQQWNCGSPGDGGEITKATLWLYLKFDGNSDGTITSARIRLNSTWHTVTLGTLPSSGAYSWVSGEITGSYGVLTGSNPAIELTADFFTIDGEVFLDVAYIDITYRANGGSLTVYSGDKATIGSIGDITFDWSESGKQSMAMFELRPQARITGWQAPGIDTKSVYWAGRIQAGELFGADASFALSWENEIATLTLTVRSGPSNSFRTLTYKPEDSGDYIHEFTDTEDGALTMYETGCYNHLGTTRFVPSYGVRSTSYSPTLHYGLPSSIIVRKVNR
jgi:hypothetical protein